MEKFEWTSEVLFSETDNKAFPPIRSIYINDLQKRKQTFQSIVLFDILEATISIRKSEQGRDNISIYSLFIAAVLGKIVNCALLQSVCRCRSSRALNSRRGRQGEGGYSGQTAQ